MCCPPAGELSRSEQPLLPYLPYPTHPQRRTPTATRLAPAPRRSDLRYGAPVVDPATGLHAPTVAVTLHPETGVALPVAGSHVDPVTGLPVVIEIGAPMVDPVSHRPVPIVAVALDPVSGQ